MIKILISVILVAAVFVSAPVNISAATLGVPVDFGSIQSAIEAATAGDTITVDPGTYTENVTITKPVTLSSVSGAAATIVVAADPKKPVFLLDSAQGVTLKGFTATGSKAAGVVARGLDGASIEDNILTGNSNGMMLYKTTGSVIEGNAADSNDLYGIYIENSTRNTVKKNTANRNKDRGIFLTFSHENTIEANKANLNTWNGITLWESNNNTITGNLTLRNTYGVVIGNSNGNIQSGNTTIPNIYIILPILLMYLGILTYLGQKRLLTYMYGKK